MKGGLQLKDHKTNLNYSCFRQEETNAYLAVMTSHSLRIVETLQDPHLEYDIRFSSS